MAFRIGKERTLCLKGGKNHALMLPEEEEVVAGALEGKRHVPRLSEEE